MCYSSKCYLCFYFTVLFFFLGTSITYKLDLLCLSFISTTFSLTRFLYLSRFNSLDCFLLFSNAPCYIFIQNYSSLDMS